MLQKFTIEQGTLEVLNQLMKLQSLKEFRLVGGTALALQTGHRMSYDIDLFGPTKIPSELITLDLAGVKGYALISSYNHMIT